MELYLLASVNLGLASPINQKWLLRGYPENPYIVLHEYKVGDELHEIRRFLEPDKIQKSLFDLEGHFAYLGILDAQPFQDVVVL